MDAHCPHPRLARTLEPRLERAEAGEYFFSFDQYLFVAPKPAEKN